MPTITCPYCEYRVNLTYVEASARTVTTDPYLATAAYTCDQCLRMLTVAANCEDPGPSNRSSPAHIMLKLKPLAQTGDWQPKTVMGKQFPDIPASIAAPASEAFECRSIGAYRAAVLMARSVIEASAKDKEITSGSLLQKIDKLAEEGHIRHMLATAAHEIRLTGNDMAHGDFATAKIDENEADELLGLMEDFLRELYELPTRVAARRAKRTADDPE